MRRILLILIEKYLKTLKPRTSWVHAIYFESKSYEVIIIIDFMRSLKVQFKTANNARNEKSSFNSSSFVSVFIGNTQSTQFFVHITKIAILFTNNFHFSFWKFSRTASKFLFLYCSSFLFRQSIGNKFLIFWNSSKEEKKTDCNII